jgi:hypothetical protein
MPNHVQNVLYLVAMDKEDIAELLNHVKSEDNPFDFNTLIPMPESLDVEDGSYSSLSHAVYTYKETGEIPQLLADYRQHRCEGMENALPMAEYVEQLLKNGEADYALGEKLYKNKELYGYATWYGWRIKHWQTKWNAYEVNVDEVEGTIRFQTAWSAPLPVIEKLASLFPKVTIRHIWSDEGIGNNCGEVSYVEGKEEYSYIPYDESNEAFKLYVECWGESNCLGLDEDGQYYHKTCEVCGVCQ